MITLLDLKSIKINSYSNFLGVEIKAGQVIDGRIAHKIVDSLLLVLEFFPGGLPIFLGKIFVDLKKIKGDIHKTSLAKFS